MTRQKRAAVATLNPLDILAMKKTVGPADADLIALPLLIHFDAARRDHGSVASSDFLTFHLIIAVAIASKLGARKFYDQSVAAYNALCTASARPTQDLGLTTGEYKTIKAAICTYLRALPNVELALMCFASMHAKKVLE